MKSLIFNNINDILQVIKSNDYDREFASIIGMAYFVDEPMGDYFFTFSEELNRYAFLFYFFDSTEISTTWENEI